MANFIATLCILLIKFFFSIVYYKNNGIMSISLFIFTTDVSTLFNENNIHTLVTLYVRVTIVTVSFEWHWLIKTITNKCYDILDKIININFRCIYYINVETHIYITSLYNQMWIQLFDCTSFYNINKSFTITTRQNNNTWSSTTIIIFNLYDDSL